MIVVLGLPISSISRILDEIDSTLDRLLLALGESKKPTPPTEALQEFFVEEEVMSWKDSLCWYFTTSLRW